MTCQIYQGDAREVLASLPEKSANLCVTSPPYYHQRDYGVDGQIGFERTLGLHIQALVAVFEEVRRVLADDGVLWINYGDFYATTSRAGRPAQAQINRGKRIERGSGRWGGGNAPAGGVLKPKDLCLASNRLAIALQESGWWVRSEVIWHKTNRKPENVKDRPKSSHEKLWMLTKSRHYWYDADAVEQPLFDVWDVPTKGCPEDHSAAFPQALIERCILTGCPPGGTVIDPFGGSGTTALIAKRLKRKCVIVELNPTYAEMMNARLNLHSEVA